jgi:hypothetical protein
VIAHDLLYSLRSLWFIQSFPNVLAL